MDEDAVAAFAAAVEAELGPPTGLVCCAGGYSAGGVAETSLADAARQRRPEPGDRLHRHPRRAARDARGRWRLDRLRRQRASSLRPFAGGVGPIVARPGCTR